MLKNTQIQPQGSSWGKWGCEFNKLLTIRTNQDWWTQKNITPPTTLQEKGDFQLWAGGRSVVSECVDAVGARAGLRACIPVPSQNCDFKSWIKYKTYMMDGWVGEWMIGWIDGWMDRHTYREIDRQRLPRSLKVWDRASLRTRTLFTGIVCTLHYVLLSLLHILSIFLGCCKADASAVVLPLTC